MEAAQQSRFYILGPNACRLGQFPIYIDKVRSQLGLHVGVIWDIDQGLDAFGLSRGHRRSLLLTAWESLNAYDLLLQLFLQIRPYVSDQSGLDGVYRGCREKLCEAIARGKVGAGLEEVLHDLSRISLEEPEPRPFVAVTGDYYTRVVPYANNEVYREIEALGGILMFPPTFSDCFKMSTLRDLSWGFFTRRPEAVLRNGILYALMAVSEYKVRAWTPHTLEFTGPRDLSGLGMWRAATSLADSRLPSGITAPIATALQQLDLGADGILNLMTLNCSFGTVVTAALSRALRKWPGLPMLTLVYDGLKKTNEKTRLEAFMEQVHGRFRARTSRPVGHLWRRAPALQRHHMSH